MTSNRSKKNKGTICVVLIISVVFLSKIALSEEKENFKRKLSINLTSGYCSMNVGDINSYLRSFDNFLSETTDYEGDKIKTLHYFPEMGLEMRLDLSSRFGVNIGIGAISERKKSSFKYTVDDPLNPSLKSPRGCYIEQKVTVLPLKLASRYSVFSSYRINLFLDAGLAYFFSKCFLYVNNPQSDIAVMQDITYSIGSSGLGLTGGVGFEYNLANFLALVIEAQGRYSKMRNLEGYTYGPGEDQEGILYIGEKYYAADDRYRPYLITSLSKPSGEEYRNMREAVLDLSGFSLKFGIRIRLF
jgi:hypothetical protein